MSKTEPFIDTELPCSQVIRRSRVRNGSARSTRDPACGSRGWRPEQVLLVGPVQGPERGSLLRPELMPLRGPEQTRVRDSLRPQEPSLQRREGWEQLRAQVRLPEPEPVRQDERTRERGQVIWPERGQEGRRALTRSGGCCGLWNEGRMRGRSSPNHPGDRENRTIQKPEFRDQRPELSERERLRTRQARSDGRRDDGPRHEPCYV